MRTIAILVALGVGFGGVDARNGTWSAAPVRTPEIRLEVGVRADGTATPLWTDGIAVALGRSAAESYAAQRVSLTPEAVAWLEVLRASLPAIPQRAAELAVPFGMPPLDATIAAGNRGSSDGFGWVPAYIGINLQAFADSYGPPDAEAQARMTRIVAHEYIHLLTYARYPDHLERRDTPFNRALWTLFFEGLGDYISVSPRWLPDEDGTDSETAARALERLEPVLVERLEALATASPEEEAGLRSGISMGKFDEKWGSLPVALWLHTEAARCGERDVLPALIRLGPEAVLPLARHHVAPELRARIDNLIAMSGHAVADPPSGPCALIDFD